MASLVVVAFHAVLISPTMANIQIAGATPPSSGFWWLLTQTPLRIFITGNEAVSVFFVLSGFVLTLQVVRPGKPFDWSTYFPRRIVRLYLPMVASLLFVCLTIIIFPFNPTTSPSIWVQSGTFQELNWGVFLQNTDLFAGNSSLNSPIWSLKWEVIFSLLLPIYVLAVRGGRIGAWLSIVVAFLLVGLGMWKGVVSLANLPIFLAGVGLATIYLNRPTTRVDRHPRPVRTHLVWSAVVLLSLFFIVGHWLLNPITAGRGRIQDALWAITVLGATGIVAAAAFWRPAASLLTTRLFAWLGRVSFSLYLVHVPVLVLTANLFPRAPWWIDALGGVVVAFVMAELFTRFVEMPSHRLSRRIQIGSTFVLTPDSSPITKVLSMLRRTNAAPSKRTPRD